MRLVAGAEAEARDAVGGHDADAVGAEGPLVDLRRASEQAGVGRDRVLEPGRAFLEHPGGKVFLVGDDLAGVGRLAIVGHDTLRPPG